MPDQGRPIIGVGSTNSRYDGMKVIDRFVMKEYKRLPILDHEFTMVGMHYLHNMVS
jgi:hypothetical protein